MRFSEMPLFLMVLGLWLPLSGFAQDAESVRRAVQSFLGEDAAITEADVEMSDALRGTVHDRCGFAPGKALQLWSVHRGDAAIGYAMVDDVKGKSRPITFLAVFDPSGTLRGIEILKYRESHGYQVKSAIFREQFEGKTVEDPIRVGKDIRNISGATISSRAVTNGARSLTTLLTVLRERKALP